MGRAGFDAPNEVVGQVEPDPDCPTVAFPNPEEPGALDLSLDLARRVDADLVLANDPDADRLAVAVPAPAAPGGWRALTGDELGTPLADPLLRRRGAGPHALPLPTLLSSPPLSPLASAPAVGSPAPPPRPTWPARTPPPRHPPPS